MRLFTCLLPLCLLLAACTGQRDLPFRADPMTGCFATGPRKAADFRIEQQAGQYQLSLRSDAQWKPPIPLLSASPAHVRQFFPNDAEQIERALLGQGNTFGLFLLRDGATLKGRARNSDYMGLLVIGAGPVYRTHCD